MNFTWPQIEVGDTVIARGQLFGDIEMRVESVQGEVVTISLDPGHAYEVPSHEFMITARPRVWRRVAP